jgi:hypothetical protein
MHDFAAHDRPRRWRLRRAHLVWFIPLVIVAAGAFFVGVGFLTTWLWRVTITDIFGVKPITFWQAWGLLLLGQLLFKANVHKNVSSRARNRCRPKDGEPAVSPSA